MSRVYLHGRETPYFDTLLTCHPPFRSRARVPGAEYVPEEDQEIDASKEDFTQLSPRRWDRPTSWS